MARDIEFPPPGGQTYTLSGSQGAASRTHPSVYSVRIVTTLAGLDDIADDWRRLEEICPQPTLFQSADWCRTIAASLLASPEGRAAPRIITVYRGNELAALLPLSILRVGRLRIARILGEPIISYADALMRPGEDAALDVILEAVRGFGDVDALVLRRVCADANIAPVCSRDPWLRLKPTPTWTVDLNGCHTLDDHGRRVDWQAHRERKRLRRRFDEAGRVEIGLAEPAEGPALIETALAWKQDWLDRSGRGSVAFSDSAWLSAKARLMSLGAGRTMPLVHVARLDGEPVAVEVGYVHRNRFYAYFGACKPGLDRLSPTRAAMSETLRYCLAQKIDIYDLMPGEDAYKSDWTLPGPEVADYVLPVGWRGAIYTELVLKRLRPLGVRLYPKIPPVIRNGLSRFRNLF